MLQKGKRKTSWSSIRRQIGLCYWVTPRQDRPNQPSPAGVHEQAPTVLEKELCSDCTQLCSIHHGTVSRWRQNVKMPLDTALAMTTNAQASPSAPQDKKQPRKESSIIREAPTGWRKLVLYFQHYPFAHVFQQAYDLIVPQLGQVNAIHWLDVIPNVQLVTSANKGKKKKAVVAQSLCYVKPGCAWRTFGNWRTFWTSHQRWADLSCLIACACYEREVLKSKPSIFPGGKCSDLYI